MNYYPAFDASDHNQLIKVTIQNENWQGSFTYAKDNNQKGNEALRFDVEVFDAQEIAQWQTQNCEIACHPDDPNTLHVLFKRPGGEHSTIYELGNEEFERMITKLEILHCTKFAIT